MGMKVDYVFLMPGSPSSNLQSINSEIARTDLILMGKRVVVIPSKSCNIYVARNGCLSNKNNGFRVDQKPFEGGKFDDYDRLIWVDSDNIVSTKDILRLIAHDVDIVGAWYRQYSGVGDLNDKNKASCGYWDREKGYPGVS